MKDKLTLNETVREALGISLLQLMETKPFYEITISEIAATAGVSRSSFYRNFASKEDLLNAYIISIYQNFFKTSGAPHSITDPAQVHDFLVSRFRFIKNHSGIYRALYQHNLLYHFFQQAEQELILLLYGQHESLSPYHRAMLSGACAGIIRCWIESDFQESEETMARIFSNPLHYVMLSHDSSV